MATWYSVEEAEIDWADSAQMEADQLTTLLAAAKDAVLAFAPVLTAVELEPVTLTTTDWSVTLSGVEGLVTADLSVGTIGAGSSESVLVPEAFRPSGAPAYVPPGAQAQGRFQNDDNETFLLTANPPGGLDFSMTWTAADTAAWTPDIPDGWRQAQLLQARNVWNSQKASPVGDFDNGSYSLSSFPLDWQVRQLIRPKRAVPVIA